MVTLEQELVEQIHQLDDTKMQRILEYVRKISMPEGELISDIVRHAQSPGFRSDDLAEIAEAVEEMTLLTRDTHFEHVDGLARQS